MASKYLPMSDGSGIQGLTYTDPFSHINGAMVPMARAMDGAESWGGAFGTAARNMQLPGQQEAGQQVTTAFRALANTAGQTVTGPETGSYVTPPVLQPTARAIGGRLAGRDLLEGHPVTMRGKLRTWVRNITGY